MTNMIKKILLFVLLYLSLVSLAFAGMPVIRDTEVEMAIRKLVNPIFKAAKLQPENIELIIINEDQINAFVAGGMNIFIFTGLLTEFDDPDVLTGVIAHETGHITGGHIAKNSEKYKNVTMASLIPYLLGAAAAAAGSPDAGLAIMSGTSHLQERELLSFSRQNEEAADQAALNFLDATKNTATGLEKLLETLSRTEYTMYSEVNPYTLTHPLSKERISHVKAHVDNSPYKTSNINSELKKQYVRAVVKLRAFLWDPKVVLAKYKGNDDDSLYARVIATYRLPDPQKALKLLDKLINDYPKDPYFYELKGQILFESGKVKESIAAYETAFKLMPSAYLIELNLATSQVAMSDSGDNSYLKPAINHLNHVLSKEKNGLAMRQLSIAYGKMGQLGLSYLALAEEALLEGRIKDAKRFADLAKSNLKPNDSSLIKVNDILNIIRKSDLKETEEY